MANDYCTFCNADFDSESLFFYASDKVNPVNVCAHCLGTALLSLGNEGGFIGSLKRVASDLLDEKIYVPQPAEGGDPHGPVEKSDD